MIEYFAGVLGVCSFLLLWFVSPLKITLAKIIFKKDIVVLDEFDDILFLKNKILGKLTACWVCLSFWLSLLVGIVLLIGFGSVWYMPLLTFLTYPSIAYIFKIIIKA